MKKSHIIVILVISLIIIFGVFFYFYYYHGENEALPVVEQGGSQTEGKNNKEETINERENASTEKDKANNTEENTGKTVLSENTENSVSEARGKEGEENTVNEEKEVKILTTARSTSSYRKTFRNPFKDYRMGPSISGEAISIEAIKEMVPFKLKGIIGNNYGRLAVIEYNNRTRIIREKTEIEDFWIIDILDNELVIVYKGIQFKLEMESGILEEL